MKNNPKLTKEIIDGLFDIYKSVPYNFDTVEKVFKKVGNLERTSKVFTHSLQLGVDPLKMIEIIESYGA